MRIVLAVLVCCSAVGLTQDGDITQSQSPISQPEAANHADKNQAEDGDITQGQFTIIRPEAANNTDKNQTGSKVSQPANSCPLPACSSNSCTLPGYLAEVGKCFSVCEAVFSATRDDGKSDIDHFLLAPLFAAKRDFDNVEETLANALDSLSKRARLATGLISKNSNSVVGMANAGEKFVNALKKGVGSVKESRKILDKSAAEFERMQTAVARIKGFACQLLTLGKSSGVVCTKGEVATGFSICKAILSEESEDGRSLRAHPILKQIHCSNEGNATQPVQKCEVKKHAMCSSQATCSAMRESQKELEITLAHF